MAGAAKVDIIVDISKLRSAVAEAQQEVASLKVNGQQVTIGGKRVDAEISRTKEEVKKLDKEVQKTGNDAQVATAKATRGLKGFGAEAKNAIGYVKTMAQGLITPWTLLIVAVEAASKTFTYFWNNLTENIDKMTARGNSAIKAAQRNMKASEQQAKTSAELIKKLEELNKEQVLTTDQKKLADSIINKLNKSYKGLGITLDQTTGKYKGLYEAQVKVDQQNRKIQEAGLRKQISGQRDVVNAVMKEVFGSGLELGKSINGSDLFTVAERMGSTMGAQNADLLAKKWGKGNDIKAIRDVFQQLMDGLSSRDNTADIQKVIDALNTLIDYQNELTTLKSASTQAIEENTRLTNSFNEQEKAINSTRDAAEKLQKQLKDNEAQQAFNALSPEKQVEALKQQVAELQQASKKLEEEKNKTQKDLETKSKNSGFARQLLDDSQRGREGMEKRLAQIPEQRKQLQRQLDKEIEKEKASGQTSRKRDQLERQLRNLQKEEVADQNALNGMNSAALQIESNYKDKKQEELALKQRIADIDNQIAQNAIDIQSKEKQRLRIQQQIADLKEKEAKAAREASEKLWQREDNAQKSLSDIAFKAENELLKRQGKEREAIIRQLTKSTEAALGRPLGEKDQALRDSIEAGADIQMALNGLNATKPNIQNDQVYSNELARMGGFSSSIVVDRMDINKEILNTNRKANDYLNTIGNNVQKIYDNTLL